MVKPFPKISQALSNTGRSDFFILRPVFFKLVSGSSASTSSGTLLERSFESETLGKGPGHLCFNKLPGDSSVH